MLDLLSIILSLIPTADLQPPSSSSDCEIGCTSEGKDEGLRVAVTHCYGTFSCFKLWVNCDGEYHCDEPGLIGCTQGSCKSVP